MFQVNLGLSLLVKALIHQLRPTKCAPEAGDSAARFASSSFPRLIIFPVGRLRRLALAVEPVETQRR